MKKLIYLLTFIFLTHFAFGQSLTDFDKNEYQSKKFGTQVWMTENLNVAHFKNGDVIPEIKTYSDWDKAYKEEKAGWSYYDNDLSNAGKYGKLYNWYAVKDSRGLAPEGWHVPADSEWKTLISYLGGNKNSVSKMKSASEFNAKAAGHRYFQDSNFYHEGVVGFWWSSTKSGTYNAYYHALHFQYNEVARDDGGMNTGFSIRCIKNK